MQFLLKMLFSTLKMFDSTRRQYCTVVLQRNLQKVLPAVGFVNQTLNLNEYI